MNGRGCNRGRLGSLWQGVVQPQPDADPYGQYVAYDTFAGADGLLTSHSPDKCPEGVVWANLGSGMFSGIMEVVSAKARRKTIASWGAAAFLDVGVSDCTLEVDASVYSGTGFDSAYILYRGVSAGNFFIAGLDVSGKATIFEYSSGVESMRGQVSMTVVSGTVYRLKVVLAGNSQTVYVDGVSKITYSSSSKATATKHGIACVSVSSPVGYALFDNFSVL